MKDRDIVVDLYSKQRARHTLIIATTVIGLFFTIVLALTLGPANIPLEEVFRILFQLQPSGSSTHETIVLQVRLPRVVLGGLVGAALATAGCAMQGLFRNPMASPYVLGISSGSAFGASLAIVFGLVLVSPVLSVPFMAFLFAVITTFLVYNIARVNGKVPTETLLLAGIAVGLFFSALVSLMKYIAGEELRAIVFWLMGGLWASSWQKVVIAAPLIVLGIVLIIPFSRDLNSMVMGEEHALNVGVDTEKVKKIILICASLVTAGAVSVSGIIGFVGLVVPHIMRILVGPDHRILLPSSCIVGAIFLISMDTLARMIIQPTEVPVGIITSLFGAPFFLFLLKKRKRGSGW